MLHISLSGLAITATCSASCVFGCQQLECSTQSPLTHLQLKSPDFTDIILHCQCIDLLSIAHNHHSHQQSFPPPLPNKKYPWSPNGRVLTWHLHTGTFTCSCQTCSWRCKYQETMDWFSAIVLYLLSKMFCKRTDVTMYALTGWNCKKYHLNIWFNYCICKMFQDKTEWADNIVFIMLSTLQLP